MNKTHSALIVILLLIISSCIFYQTVLIYNKQKNNNDTKIIFKEHINDKNKSQTNYSNTTQATHISERFQNPKPSYPKLSLENGEQGIVGLIVVVEPDGRPSDVQLSKSSGYHRLDYSALKTVREKYKFEPATREGVPIQAKYSFNIVFKI